ncbi:hypothetical protein GN244_ATG14134 [Phytophthora infestans]|uniref:Tim44-like domain-containing protein n=1 Tax=Phytophthora infestans TaxID=4787 RepID=A0A833SVP1_PHYIN|nr:hypothetical protein GN244_ATG14134 [Phytophthora infestans]
MLGRTSARSLLLSRQQLIAARKLVTKPVARCFSTSRDGDNSPLLENASKAPGVSRNGVFIDSLGIMGQCWLIVLLYLPRETNVDLLEFLEGAHAATEANLRAMNSVEFPTYLADMTDRSSQVAENLKQYTTPAYYNRMALQVKKNYLHRNFYIDCEAMRVEKAQLARVVYRRLTEKEYDDLVEFKKQPAATSPEATIEHLALHVDVATVEDLNVVYTNGKTRSVQHQNVYRVVFESRVTGPQEVDWRIESMHIIEQKAIPRADKNAADEEKNK